MSKIFEHLIHQQLTVHLEKILHNSIFGYRKYHGCPTALLALTEQWKEDLDIIALLARLLTVYHMT